MDVTKLQSAIEAIIFASREPVSVEELINVFDLNQNEITGIINNIKDAHDLDTSGIELLFVAGGYIFKTKAMWAKEVESLSMREISAALTPAALETLAIIAYKQPITKGEIEKIRSVSTESSIASLLERDLIKECGRKNAPGRPILYGTTDIFLNYLGLSSISALPPLDEENNFMSELPLEEA